MTEGEARRRLEAAGASSNNAAAVAAALAENEAEGNTVCGWFYLPVFEDQLKSGRLDGKVKPTLERVLSVVRVDAAKGFAQPAIALGMPELVSAAKDTGIAALAIRRSYNALALGPWVRRIAHANLIGLAFANAPASVAPPGVVKPIFGTNPFAVAVPVASGDAIVLDQSTSAVAKTEVIMRADAVKALEVGWAQDSGGTPTINARDALVGALLPAGGRKGAGVSLLVEILAAVVTGGTLSADATPLGDAKGEHPELGQLFIAIDAHKLGGGDGSRLLDILVAAGAHVPGSGRSTARKSRE